MAALDDTPAPAPPDRTNLVDCAVLEGQQVIRPGGHVYNVGEEFEADAAEAKQLAAYGLVDVLGPSRVEPYEATTCACGHHG